VPSAARFDGKRFSSPGSPELHGVGDFLRWITDRERGPWREFTDAPPGPAPPRQVGGGRMRVAFVNHSTVLLQMDGINVLTDPVWSERVSPISFAGPRRHRPPGLRFEDLPPIDAVLVSHDHYDHMDQRTLTRLAESHAASFFVATGNAARLSRFGIPRGRELAWWESAELAPGVAVTAVPAWHFSGRTAFDRDRTLWCGFVVSGPSGAAYFAGDTGWGPHFEEIGRRFPGLRLAMLPIGAYRPRWFMSPMHIDPAEAVAAQKSLGASTALAVHWGTFAQADDGEFEPVEELRKALDRQPEPRPRFVVLENGESLEVL
jgi:L-ascorbate metabolism protein UlaG (beta-lactamase superfamily)